VFLPGPVPLDGVMASLAGFDVASLPQSVDAVGSFRYTTKISEYAAASLPIVTSRTPASYDLSLGRCWRLPGRAPWDEPYVAALADLMSSLTRDGLTGRSADIATTFDREAQVARVTEYLLEWFPEAARLKPELTG
jgi:hypothetical protein